MAAKKTSPDSMKFIVSALTKNKDVSYADVRAKAEKKGLTVYPIMYGRAKALLGLVPTAKRGESKAKKAVAKRAAAGGVPKRGPGRPRRDVGGSAADSIATVITALQEGGQERERFRKALEQIRAIVDGLA